LRKVAERTVKEELWICEGSDEVDELIERSKPLIGFEVRRGKEGYWVIVRRRVQWG